MSCRIGASPVVVAGAQQLQRKKEKHSTHQNLNHVKENISTIDTKAAEAGLSEQMKQEPEKLLNDILSHPSKQKRRIAKYTPTKNTKISEVRPRRSKQQPRLDNNPVNRVENSPDDSKNFVDVKEIMKDMSKLLPHIVLQRVPFPRVAAPSQLQLVEQQESSANHDKEEQSRSETASSSLEEGGSPSAELGSLHPIDENCLMLDVFLSRDKKEDDAKLKSTVIVQSATDPEVVPEESTSKEKSCISENIENSVAADGPAVILDVNLDICVEGGGHVELYDVKCRFRMAALFCNGAIAPRKSCSSGNLSAIHFFGASNLYVPVALRHRPRSLENCTFLPDLFSQCKRCSAISSRRI